MSRWTMASSSARWATAWRRTRRPIIGGPRSGVLPRPASPPPRRRARRARVAAARRGGNRRSARRERRSMSGGADDDDARAERARRLRESIRPSKEHEPDAKRPRSPRDFIEEKMRDERERRRERVEPE